MIYQTMKLINDNIKDKILVYIGAFFSQVSTLIAVMMIVRYSSVEKSAQLALVDAFMLFLPMLITFMSERTAVIISFDKISNNKCKVFSASCLFSFFIFCIVITCYMLLNTILDYSVTDGYDYLIIIASFSMAIYNVVLQNYVLNKDYLGLARVQVVRGGGLILVVLLSVVFDLDNIQFLLLAYIFSSFLSSFKTILNYTLVFEKKLFFEYFNTFIKLGYIPIVIVVFSFVISNGGRLFLEYNGSSYDLALLLVYSKSLLILMSVFMPLSNYFKPKLLELLQRSRKFIPDIWDYLILFATYASLLFLMNFKYLWELWGMEDKDLSIVLFSIMICGGVYIWIMNSVIELYFEKKQLITKKLTVYSIPTLLLLFSYKCFGEDIDVSLVIYSIVLVQLLLLTIAISLSYGLKSSVKPLLSLLLSSSVIISFGFLLEVFYSNMTSLVIEHIISASFSFLMLVLMFRCLFSSKLEID